MGVGVGVGVGLRLEAQAWVCAHLSSCGRGSGFALKGVSTGVSVVESSKAETQECVQCSATNKTKQTQSSIMMREQKRSLKQVKPLSNAKKIFSTLRIV